MSATSKLRSPDEAKHNEFQKKLKELIGHLSVDERDLLARKLGANLGYSTNTIRRWFDGKTSPMYVVFPNVYRAIKKLKQELSLT